MDKREEAILLLCNLKQHTEITVMESGALDAGIKALKEQIKGAA